MKKAEDKEKAATVESDKVKEKSLAVARGRCWKKVLLKVLQNTGDPNTCFSMEDKIAQLCFLQRPGFCPAPPFLSLWSTHALPLNSTTRMAKCCLVLMCV